MCYQYSCNKALRVGRKIDYTARVNLNLKVLDFVQVGGLCVTVLQTFEWVVFI